MDNAGTVESLDVLSFIDSKAVREYCEVIDWKPSSVEAAFLVWQSEDHDIAERHEAWEFIVNNMSDEEIVEGVNRDYRPSLHELLKEYMSFEDRIVAGIYGQNGPFKVDGDGYYWVCDVEYDNSKGHLVAREMPIHIEDGCPCRSFDAAVKHTRESIDEEEADLVKSYLVSKIPFGQSLSYGNGITRIRFTKQLEPMRILNAPCPMSEEDMNLWTTSFDGMWFDFPTPFQPGDIVFHPKLNSRHQGYLITRKGPDPTTDEGKRLLGLFKTRADVTDMCYSGCMVDPEDGYVDFHCHLFDYLHLEYMTDTLIGYERKLEPIGSFITGRIGVRECASQCEMIDLDTEYSRKRKHATEKSEGLENWFGFDVNASDLPAPPWG